MPSLSLSLLPDAYAIYRYPSGREVMLPSSGGFSLLVHAIEETTLVCPADQVPPEAEIDADWRCFRILQNFDFSTPGILASVLNPLVQAGIGIFATSTFSTDYVLVKAVDEGKAVRVLEAAGHSVVRALTGNLQAE